MDANDFLMSGGTKGAKFDKVGKTVKGTIVREPELQQQKDIDDGTPKVWADGNPMMQVKVILATTERDPDDADDNGERAVYLKGNSLKAVQTAIKNVKAKGLAVGGKLALKYTGDAEPKKKGYNGAKLYSAFYEAPDPVAVAAASEPDSEPEAEDADDLKF